MSMNSTSFLKSLTDLPSGIDIDSIAPFVSLIPGKFVDNSPKYKSRFISHFRDIIAKIEEIIPESERTISQQTKYCSEESNEKLIYLPSVYPYEDIILKYRVLAKTERKLNKKIQLTNLKFAQIQLELIKSIKSFALWLLDNPIPLFINLNRAVPDISANTFSDNQQIFRQERAFKLALKDQAALVNGLPPVFGNKKEYQALLRSAVDMGMGSRKSDTTYFEELSVETALHAFFESAHSPLVKNHLIPIKAINNFDSVKSWIDAAVASLAKLDNIDNVERKEVINVFVLRYFFSKTYPLCGPIEMYNKNINKAEKYLSSQIIEKTNIPKKYIPKSNIGKPVSGLFKNSTISSAPKEWLLVTQYKACPLDAAYCIFKAHEALSIMITLQTSPHGSKDFFQNMPGFDDIFDIWISLVASSEFPDPIGICDFLSKWSGLQGFPSRFLACIAYFEASVQQIALIAEKADLIKQIDTEESKVDIRLIEDPLKL